MQKHPEHMDDRFIPADPQTTQDIAYPVSRFNPFQLHKQGKHFKALFALLLVCFFWGTTWIVSKKGVMHLPAGNKLAALQLAGIRQVLAGLCFVVYFSLKKGPWPRRAQWRPILVLSFLNFMLSNALSTWGMRFIPAGLGSIIAAIYPVWLVVIGLLTRSVRLNRRSATGMLLGFGGICIIFYEHLHHFINPDFRLGILISVASTWSWAFGTLYTKKQAANFNPYFSLGLQLLISGAVLLSGLSASGNTIPFTEIPWQSWAAIAYLVLFGTIISFVAFLYALQQLPTTQVSLYAYVNPVVAVLLGAALINEPLTAFICIGTAVTLYGVYLVNRAVSRP
jgi:drug/metabolite transporter (DMT)-like permease